LPTFLVAIAAQISFKNVFLGIFINVEAIKSFYYVLLLLQILFLKRKYKTFNDLIGFGLN
jgi:hypothetical protein